MNGAYKVTILPSVFDMPPKSWAVSANIPTPDFTLRSNSPLYPEIPHEVLIKRGEIFIRPGVNIKLPDKVIIEVDEMNLNAFNWRGVIIPVVIGVSFTRDMAEKGLSMSFADKEGRKQPRTVAVDPEAWRNPHTSASDLNNPHSPYQRPIFEEDGFGESDYWNMTYFTDLPKCSMSYDFWVTVRGVDSARKVFETEFHVDGQKITQSNFAAMTEKYPALKENAPQ